MDTLQQILTILAPVLIAGASYLAYRVENAIEARTKLEIDGHHRDALQSAFRTGAKLAIAMAGKDAAGTAAANAEMRRIVTDYVRQSVTDAVGHFTPSDDHMDKMAAANLVEAAAKVVAAK